MSDEFPRWEGAKLVVALRRELPWLLIVRADLAVKRGDLSAVKGLRLTAAEGLDLASVKCSSTRISIRTETCESWNCRAPRRDVSFGVFAARALEEGTDRWLLGQRYGRRNCGPAG